MNLEDLVKIDEGIRFFKDSKKLKKLVKKLKMQINTEIPKIPGGDKNVAEVKTFIKNVEGLQKKFEIVENAYQSGDPKAKEKYLKLKNEAKDVLNKVKKDAFLKGFNIFSRSASLFFTLTFIARFFGIRLPFTKG